MKKILISVFAIILLLVSAFFYIKSHFLPLSTYVLEKITGLRIEATSINIRFIPWVLELHLNKVKVSGIVKGNVGSVSIAVDLKKGYWLKSLTISDFNLSVRLIPQFGHRLSMPPVEHLLAKNGDISIGDGLISISEVKIVNLVRGRTFDLVGEVGYTPFFVRATLSLQGKYWETLERLDGSYEVKDLNTSIISSGVKGKIDLTGKFLYKPSKLIGEGHFRTSYVSISGEIFREPYFLTNAFGTINFSYVPEFLSLESSVVNSDGVKIGVQMEIKKGALKTLKLNTNEMELKKITKHVDVEALTGYDPSRYVKDGKIRIVGLSYKEGFPMEAKVILTQTSITLQSFQIENVEGELILKDKDLFFQEVAGSYRSSRIKDLKGKVSFLGEMSAKMEGKFSFQLPDIHPLINFKGIELLGGSADGFFVVTFDEKTGLKYTAKGEISGGKGNFFGQGVDFWGNVELSNDVYILKSLYVTQGDTNLKIDGSINKGYDMDLHVEGKLSAGSIRSLRKVNLDMEGLCVLKGKITKKGDLLALDGEFDFTDFAIFSPPFFKKEKGVKSRVELDLVKDKDEVRVRELVLNLKGLHLKGSGKGNSSTMECNFTLNVEDLGDLAPCFYMDETRERGRVEAGITLRDFRFSLDRLPYIKGYVNVKNGFIKLPHLRHPIKNVDLRAIFEGEKLNIKIDGAKIGSSVLKSANITVEGIGEPTLTGFCTFQRVNTSDLEREKKGKFILPIIKEKDMAWRSKVYFKIWADELIHKDVRIDSVSIELQKEGPEFALRHFTAKLLKGDGEASGILNLSYPKPSSRCEIRIKGVDLAEFSSLLKKEYVFEGKVTLLARLKTEGFDSEEMEKKLRGEIYVISRKGTIKKWNLIARVLELLNIYQVMKLRLDLTKEGIIFSKMGGTFSLENGKLQTKDFTIDSPSMIIVAKGEIDSYTKGIKGTISVLPLVAFEKTIDKIPILRNILKSKGRSLLSVDYTVGGELSDPKVRLDVVKTIPYKVIDIIKNVLTLPMEILELEKGGE